MSKIVEFRLNGKVLQDLPPEWKDINIGIDFGREGVQANINIDTFTFLGDGYDAIKAWVDAGRAFEGMPFEIYAEDSSGRARVYDGLLNYAGTYQVMGGQRIKTKLYQKDSVEFIDERLNGVTYGLLKEEGIITSADYTDVPVIVVKKFDSTEIALLALSLFSVSSILYDFIFKRGDEVIQTTRAVIAPTPGTKVVEIVGKILKLLILAIYIASMIILIYQTLKNLVNAIRPARGTYKGITYRRALEKAFEYLGFGFESSIEDLDMVYMPSKKGETLRENRKADGIPQPEDFQYNCANMVETVLNTFYAKPTIIGKTVHIEPRKSPFNKKRSTFKMPSTKRCDHRLNIDELIGTQEIAYTTDIVDEWTIDNYTGTSYQITTEQQSYQDKDNRLIKGYDKVLLPVALASRKDAFSGLEDALNVLIKQIGDLSQKFGIKSNVKPIDIGRGRVKISRPFFNVPKVVKLTGGQLGDNYRDAISAKYLWNNYHNEKSFVYNAQATIWENVKAEFFVNNFEEIKQSPYFDTYEGEEAEFETAQWNLDEGTIVSKFRIKHVFCENLKEIYIEP